MFSKTLSLEAAITYVQVNAPIVIDLRNQIQIQTAESKNLGDSRKSRENMLKTKYKIEKCIIEMGELLINIFLNDRILDFCKKNKELTLRVTTKDKTYKLSKDIK